MDNLIKGSIKYRLFQSKLYKVFIRELLARQLDLPPANYEIYFYPLDIEDIIEIVARKQMATSHDLNINLVCHNIMDLMGQNVVSFIPVENALFNHINQVECADDIKLPQFDKLMRGNLPCFMGQYEEYMWEFQKIKCDKFLNNIATYYINE